MSLKAGRNEQSTRIDCFMNEVATRGCFVSYSTGGSGEAMDDASQLVTVAANPSGKVAVGVLLNDMVNLDLTRQHINWYKNEIQKGGKVTILERGWVTTNFISGTPTIGQTAYLANSGYVSPTQATGAPAVGRFDSVKDNEGFAKVTVNLP